MPSNHIIFGFLNNEFIEFMVENSNEFESTWQEIEDQLEEGRQEGKQEEKKDCSEIT